MFSYFYTICLFLTLSLSVSSHTHASSAIPSNKNDFHHIFLYKPWNYRSKCLFLWLGRNIPLTPTSQNNVAHSWGRPRLFLFLRAERKPAKRKSSSNPPNRQTVMFISLHEVVYAACSGCLFQLIFEVLNCVMLSVTEQRGCNLTCRLLWTYSSL